MKSMTGEYIDKVYLTSPMDADRPKNLGRRVMGAPRWTTGKI